MKKFDYSIVTLEQLEKLEKDIILIDIEPIGKNGNGVDIYYAYYLK
jgi:hypothetical protein